MQQSSTFTMMRCVSFLKSGLRTALPALIVFGLLFSGAPPCLASWERDDIGFSFHEQNQLVIGDGRDDGAIRVYAGDDGGGISEFSFVGDDWDKASVGQDVSKVYGLAIGGARNDGKMRIYASGYNLAEYWYESGSWLGGTTGPYIQWTNDLALGDARNDGVVRMYIAEWDGILELTYSSGAWNEVDIDTGGQSMERLLIADGRNDGILRLYAATGWDDHVYEYTWSGSTWEVDDCGTPGAVCYYDMVAGDGRNDGTNRIYLAANWGGIYELSYDGGAWEYEVIANPASDGYVGAVALGNGRNDGMNRVYSWYSPSMDQHHLAEYTYDGAWSATSFLDAVVVAYDIAVGDGRNDGVNRVYSACADNHVYEYSFVESTSVEWKDNVPTPCVCLGRTYPNPFNERTSIHYSLTQPVHVTLGIYDLRGNLVHTIVDRIEGAGEHTVDWDGRNWLGIRMGSGLYVCSLETPGFTQRNKLLLVR